MLICQHTCYTWARFKKLFFLLNDVLSPVLLTAGKLCGVTGALVESISLYEGALTRSSILASNVSFVFLLEIGIC